MLHARADGDGRVSAALQGLDHRQLLAGARNPEDFATLAFCGVLARFPIFKLGASDLIRLIERFFPGAAASAANFQPLSVADVCTAIPPEELDDLLALFHAHRLD